MDLDAYVDAHSPRWRRLEDLVRKRRLTAAEADEMLDLYQRTATHLSVVRTVSPEPETVAYLSWLLARARARAGEPANAGLGTVIRFLAVTFPAALYRLRRWWLVTMLVSAVVTLALGGYFLANPQIEAALMTSSDVDDLVNRDFANYYSEYAASSFAFQVWTNNAWVSALCIAFGILGVPIVLLLWNNLLNLALVASVMIRHDRADVFFGLITPHGLLELTAVFVAAGVGLRLFWSWIEPGPRTRMQAIAEEGRTAVGVALGLVLVLLISGGIEAFVTPSPLPTWVRIVIGMLAEAAFFGYVFVLGRWAVQGGETGDVTAEYAVDVAPSV